MFKSLSVLKMMPFIADWMQVPIHFVREFINNNIVI
jgi:hypothetical protein